MWKNKYRIWYMTLLLSKTPIRHRAYSWLNPKWVGCLCWISKNNSQMQNTLGKHLNIVAGGYQILSVAGNTQVNPPFGVVPVYVSIKKKVGWFYCYFWWGFKCQEEINEVDWIRSLVCWCWDKKVKKSTWRPHYTQKQNATLRNWERESDWYKTWL